MPPSTGKQQQAGAQTYDFNKAYANAGKVEPPRQLLRDLPPADPFPIDALGPVLSKAALAINDKTLAPPALCGNAVLAAAALAVQAQVDVLLPTGLARPCSLFLLTIGKSGERKSDVDLRASVPIARREAELGQDEDNAKLIYENDRAVWELERKNILAQKGKMSVRERKEALARLGTPPTPPLEPILTCAEPTVEGLVKLLAVGQPSCGLFSSESGQFLGGYGMSPDNKLKTAAALSQFWDGLTIKRVRSGDGSIVLPGRRVSLHLMCQPDVASILLADPLFMDQGLTSRILLSAPDTTCGARFSRLQNQRRESDRDLAVYVDRVYEILTRELPLATGKRNQLEPRPLPLAPAAVQMWWRSSDEIEARLAPDGELEAIRGLGNKLAEHAARIAAILQIVQDLNSAEVDVDALTAGVELVNHYSREAQRLFLVGARNADLILAERLLAWLQTKWTEPSISLSDIYRFGPNQVREKATATKLVDILEDHGWLDRDDTGGVVRDTWRKTVWSIVSP